MAVTAVPVQLWQGHATRGAELEAEGDDRMWEAAEEYWTASVAGGTQRQIARLVGKSQTHVSRMIRAFESRETRPELSFSQVYSLVQGRGQTGSYDLEAVVEEAEELAMSDAEVDLVRGMVARGDPRIPRVLSGDIVPRGLDGSFLQESVIRVTRHRRRRMLIHLEGDVESLATTLLDGADDSDKREAERMVTDLRRLAARLEETLMTKRQPETAKPRSYEPF
jgi:hypothetical protein